MKSLAWFLMVVSALTFVVVLTAGCTKKCEDDLGCTINKGIKEYRKVLGKYEAIYYRALENSETCYTFNNGPFENEVFCTIYVGPKGKQQ